MVGALTCLCWFVDGFVGVFVATMVRCCLDGLVGWWLEGGLVGGLVGFWLDWMVSGLKGGLIGCLVFF